MDDAIFVTGATGNVGRETVRHLLARGRRVIAAKLPSERTADEEGLSYREFSFEDRASWERRMDGADRVFLMRPPHISNIKRDMLPFMGYLKERGVKQVVFMSVQGAERNKIVPHRAVEDYLVELGLPYTIVRPSFFMQNLTTTHLAEIRDERRLFVPAGRGRTNFIDVRDLGELCASLFDGEGHFGKAYTVTGERSYSYGEVAERLSAALGTTICYESPGPLHFLAYHLSRGRKLGMSAVMLALYSVVRFGKGDINTNTTAELLGRTPRSLDAFIADHLGYLRGSA